MTDHGRLAAVEVAAGIGDLCEQAGRLSQVMSCFQLA
jgi:hypothetical protein